MKGKNGTQKKKVKLSLGIQQYSAFIADIRDNYNLNFFHFLRKTKEDPAAESGQGYPQRGLAAFITNNRY